MTAPSGAGTVGTCASRRYYTARAAKYRRLGARLVQASSRRIWGELSRYVGVKRGW
jgi:hypothetical protein